MPRLFYALWPDAATRAALATAAARVDVREARRVQPGDLHLTLSFLGEIGAADAERLQERTAPALPGFTLEFGLCGWWRASRVAWLAPLATPVELLSLQAWTTAAGHSVGVPPETRGFQPHVTVARRVTRVPRTSGGLELTWQVTDFALVESLPGGQPERYRVRAAWRLEGPPGDEKRPPSVR
ncbi:MAG: RNA 2',3'-cyclic phosphodiesterase [Gammaproteobacteria bacterium]|nr:RNA 2',3'-cyclic phosphodiesterase [Gammaproteobacteria bacterium]